MPDSPPVAANRAVFLSYAREDLDAARRIADALRGFGVEVWFDQSALKGGDAWDAHIKRQIRECALFISIISANCEARHEGYFRREWNLAVDRTLDMAHDAPFLLPIAIDDTTDATARVPDRFRSVQWTRLPGGVPTPEMVAHVHRLLEAPGQSVVPFRGHAHPSFQPAGNRSAPLPPAAAPVHHRLHVLALGSIAAIAVAAAVWLWLRHPRTDLASAPAPGASATPAPTPVRAAARPVVSKKSVAVLAFVDLSPGKDGAYFSDGISEELLNVLAKVPGLHVPARTSSFFFKGQNLPIPEIAEKLGVAYVIEGSVRRSGDLVRITAQLIDAATGYHVWSHNFDRDPQDLFAVQDEIALEVTRILQLKLADTPRAAKTLHPEAHRLVLEGRHFWNLRNEEGFARAEASFTRALSLDPQFAEAHAGLAEVCVLRANYRQFDGFGETAGDLKRARLAAGRAIELDATLAEPHAALGYVSILEGRLVESERQFQGALALNPNSAVIQCWYAMLLSTRGKLDQSLAAYERASTLDPFWFINLHRQAWLLARARRFDEALRVNEQAASLLKDAHMPNQALRALILLELGQKKEAAEAARLVTQRPDKEPRWQADSDAIWVLRQAGFEKEASDHARRLFKKLPADSYNRGFVLAALGRLDEALPFLERTPVTPSRGFLWDAMWDPWRDDPRFQQLLVKLGRLEDYNTARSTLARTARQTDPAKPNSGGR